MLSGRNPVELALLALVCVVTIFLFPSIQGPYPVVHGPVSALSASRAAARLRISIVQGALALLTFCLASPLAVLTPVFRSCSPDSCSAPPVLASILRC